MPFVFMKAFDHISRKDRRFPYSSSGRAAKKNIMELYELPLPASRIQEKTVAVCMIFFSILAAVHRLGSYQV